MIKIKVTHRTAKHVQEYDLEHANIVFGRHASCDVILSSDAVSRQHARLAWHEKEQQFTLEDLGSGNGTFFQSQKLEPQEKKSVGLNGVFKIDDFEIAFQYGVTEGTFTSATGTPFDDSKTSVDLNADAFSPTDTDLLEIRMIKKVLGGLDPDKQPSVTVISEPFVGTKSSFEEGQTEIVVGRDRPANLLIDCPDISRRHAVIAIKWGHYIVRDLQSKNGTFVNGRRIEESPLRDGDEIIFGTVKALFKNPQEFDIEEIAKTLEAQKQENKITNFEATSEFKRIDIEDLDTPKAEKNSLSSEDIPSETSENDVSESERPKKENVPVLFGKPLTFLVPLLAKFPQLRSMPRVDFWHGLTRLERIMFVCGILFLLVLVFGMWRLLT